MNLKHKNRLHYTVHNTTLSIYLSIRFYVKFLPCLHSLDVSSMNSRSATRSHRGALLIFFKPNFSCQIVHTFQPQGLSRPTPTSTRFSSILKSIHFFCPLLVVFRYNMTKPPKPATRLTRSDSSQHPVFPESPIYDRCLWGETPLSAASYSPLV